MFFSNSTSYVTPSLFSNGWWFGVLSIANWGGSCCDSLKTSPVFSVVSFTSSNFFVNGVKISANLKSWVCCRILFYISTARWIFCGSANLRRLIKSCSDTFEKILIYLF